MSSPKGATKVANKAARKRTSKAAARAKSVSRGAAKSLARPTSAATDTALRLAGDIDASLADGRLVDIGIAGGRISTIGVDRAPSLSNPVPILDIAGDLVLPGPVDGHMYLDKTLMRLPRQGHDQPRFLPRLHHRKEGCGRGAIDA